MRRSHHSERDQLELFRALPGDLAPRDAQDLMAYPFFSLAKTKRIVPIDFRAGAIAIRVLQTVHQAPIGAKWVPAQIGLFYTLWTASLRPRRTLQFLL